MIHRSNQPQNWLRWPLRLLLLLFLLLIGPLSILAFGELDLATHWSAARWDSTDQAPSPQAEPQALVQVYAARAYNWRGAFAVHTWIASKRAHADHYWIYQVIGWNLYRGRSAVSVSQGGPPDFPWFNAYPKILLDRRGPDVEPLIDRIEQAVSDYPYEGEYRAWPGPNSNTFTAFVARQVPELRLDLPPTAIGKDYLPNGRFLDQMPSGTGWQVSLFGLLGAGLAGEEGLEVNLLGLAAGIDPNDLALRLPGFGKLGLR